MVASQMEAWQKGVTAELRFWDLWYATKGLEWPIEYANRLRQDTEFPAALLDGLGDDPRVLDVGSGPLTLLGKNYKGQPVNITACDPLAPYYTMLSVKHDIDVPVPVRQAFAEDLSFFFDPGSFDLVYCANALDHSFDPIRGIEEMLIVARIGGRVVLQHATNEAEREQYIGFHQWNFDEEGGQFVIWNKSGKIDASERFRHFSSMEIHKQEGSISVSFLKTGEPVGDLKSRSRERVKELLEAFLSIGASASLNSL
ncbi:MAG: methyltransferase domain-containing protein [Chitinophagaceae bacterium]|nr:methyltransferase domain-containing protein [Chitinophagaceae bacterium]